MNTTGSQIAKTAIPAVVLTGSGFLGTLAAATIVVVGVVTSGILMGILVSEIIGMRRSRKLRGKPETT